MENYKGETNKKERGISKMAVVNPYISIITLNVN